MTRAVFERVVADQHGVVLVKGLAYCDCVTKAMREGLDLAQCQALIAAAAALAAGGEPPEAAPAASHATYIE
ncbi:MAG: hypothetical protein GDA49_09175 [Rhodospirillales bacterium]|nr:hypothetical protein [Rhodospirillales bacterium]